MIEVEVEGKRVFLKKSGDSYRVIHPIKVDGKIVWKNLIAGGNWLNLVWIGLQVGIILFLAWSYKHDVEAIRQSCMPMNNILNNGLNFSWG